MTLEEWEDSQHAKDEVESGSYRVVHDDTVFLSVQDFIDETAARFGFDPTRIAPFVTSSTMWTVRVFTHDEPSLHIATVDVPAAAVAKEIALAIMPYG